MYAFSSSLTDDGERSWLVQISGETVGLVSHSSVVDLAKALQTIIL